MLPTSPEVSELITEQDHAADLEAIATDDFSANLMKVVDRLRGEGHRGFFAIDGRGADWRKSAPEWIGPSVSEEALKVKIQDLPNRPFLCIVELV